MSLVRLFRHQGIGPTVINKIYQVLKVKYPDRYLTSQIETYLGEYVNVNIQGQGWTDEEAAIRLSLLNTFTIQLEKFLFEVHGIDLRQLNLEKQAQAVYPDLCLLCRQVVENQPQGLDLDEESTHLARLKYIGLKSNIEIENILKSMDRPIHQSAPAIKKKLIHIRLLLLPFIIDQVRDLARLPSSPNP